MPKRVIEYFVLDILIAIDKVKRYSEGIETYEEFVEDEKSYSAIMRELEIIGEALKHVLGYPSLQSLVTPSWRAIVDFRNIIAHEYFGIIYGEIFKVVRFRIHEFEVEFIDFVKSAKSLDLKPAIKAVDKELRLFQHHQSIDYLEKIKEHLS